MSTNLNDLAKSVCDEAATHPSVSVSDVGGATLVNFAPDGKGTFEGGVLLARICMADLAKVTLSKELDELGLRTVQVETNEPIKACIAAQYAGWPFQGHEKVIDGKAKRYFAMCSGPARMARGQEEILERYDLVSAQDQVVGILESAKIPEAADIEVFAEECGVATDQVTLCVAPTSSRPGLVQIVARSIETSLHKLHELGFDLNLVESGVGSAPIPPGTNDDMVALGWTNDSILYGASVELKTSFPSEQIDDLGPSIPSDSSPDFGRPFRQIFEEYEWDFYKIDKLLFSPAKISLLNSTTNNSQTFGRIHPETIRKSFGI